MTFACQHKNFGSLKFQFPFFCVFCARAILCENNWLDICATQKKRNGSNEKRERVIIDSLANVFYLFSIIQFYWWSFFVFFKLVFKLKNDFHLARLTHSQLFIVAHYIAKFDYWFSVPFFLFLWVCVYFTRNRPSAKPRRILRLIVKINYYFFFQSTFAFFLGGRGEVFFFLPAASLSGP